MLKDKFTLGLFDNPYVNEENAKKIVGNETFKKAGELSQRKSMVLLKNKVFFYDPTQGGLIVFFTIVIPSLGLTFWATSGTISEQRIQSQLLRFVIPVGFTSALASLVVYYIFESLTGESAYAQLGVTYILSLTGMLMVLFIKPPDRFWVGDSPLSGDRRFVWMVMVMFILCMGHIGWFMPECRCI